MNPFTTLPTPRFCPAPDPAYPYNEGAEVARIARLLGGHLQPWQRLVINRGTQWRPATNAQGRPVREYKYKTVLVSVPRQSGKTYLSLPKQMHSLLLRPGSQSLFTAQTGADARIQIDEMIKRVLSSPMGELVTPKYTNGSEGLVINESSSQLRRFSPTFSAVHGGHPHLVFLDEIWKHSKELGDALLGAIRPSQVTIREEAQIWMISTKGTAKSEFMNTLIDEALEHKDEKLCYIEFSMPDGLDPYDPGTWWKFHPALGNTINEDSLTADMGLPYGEWMRGYMNVIVSAENPLIPLEDFDHLAASPEQVPDLNDVCISYEVAALGECASVVAAWNDADGTPCVRVVKQEAGTAWLAPYVASLAKRWPRIRFYADDGGPTRAVTDALSERDDFEPEHLETLNMTERCVADANFMRACLETKNLKHDGSEALRMAVANVVAREYNGTRRFDRDRSTAPISALIAASVALYGASHQVENFWVLA